MRENNEIYFTLKKQTKKRIGCHKFVFFSFSDNCFCYYPVFKLDFSSFDRSKRTHPSF